VAAAVAVAAGADTDVLSDVTPLDPWDRRDELDLALLVVALVTVPGACERVRGGLRDQRPALSDLPPAARRVTRPGAGVRPPRAC
jgi:hypothetical protein